MVTARVPCEAGHTRALSNLYDHDTFYLSEAALTLASVKQPANKGPRTNERITSPQVRLIDQDGTNHGIVTTTRARELALEAGLDLVEVAAEANPPVCRIADAGKLLYEASIKAKEVRRGSKTAALKELKYRPVIEANDYNTKTNWAKKFLEQGHSVKITVMLRGREQGRPEMAERIFERLVVDLTGVGTLRGAISRLGRDVIATFEPAKTDAKKPEGKK